VINDDDDDDDDDDGDCGIGAGTEWAGWACVYLGNYLSGHCPSWIFPLFRNSLGEDCPPYILCKNSTVI